MFGIGGTELLVILLVALLVLGPQKLPEVARTLGKVFGDLRRMSTDFQRSLNTEIAFDESNREQEAKKARKQDAPVPDKTDQPTLEKTGPEPVAENAGEPDAVTGGKPKDGTGAA